MYPSMFRERIYKLSREVMDKNPPSMTGYFDSPGHLKEEMLRTAPDVSLNGQRTSTSWATFDMGPSTTTGVFRVKDPKGSKEAVGFYSYRINGLLIPGSTGKFVSMRAEPGQEMVLGDAIFQGSKFQAPTIVSMLNTSKPPDSTLTGAQEGQSAGMKPVDPMTGGGIQISSDNSTDNKGTFLSPALPKFTDLDPSTGQEFFVPEARDASSPFGTNARTGTTLLGGQDLAQPAIPSSVSSGWSFKGGADLTKAFQNIRP